jgi:hypothetical protein
MKQFLLVSLLLLSACVPSAPTRTPTAAPALPGPTALPAATPDPYRELDAVLQVPFPLPPGYLPGEIEHHAPSLYAEKSMPAAKLAVSVPITNPNNYGALVTVFVYDDQATRDNAYMALVAAMKEDTETVPSIGEHATGKKYMIFETELAFVRCTALVDILRYEDLEIAALIENARLLDENLQPVVCP